MVLVAAVTTAPSLAAGQTPAPAAGKATFDIFIRGMDLGVQETTVTSSENGWTITGSGRIGLPLDLVTHRFEMRYDRTWKPIELTVESTTKGMVQQVRTSFSGATAKTDANLAGRSLTDTDQVSEGTIVLSDSFFGAYEGLAPRLAATLPGATIAVYYPLQAEILLRVDGVTDERIEAPTRGIVARRHRVTFIRPDGTTEAEIWTDENKRLLRVSFPAASVEAVRRDIATVAARRATMTREGDEDVRVPSSGFSLAGTLSKPSGAKPPRGFPAIVLVPGDGSQDRDETIAGIPIYGQLASQLADAGFLVLRYDKRGVALSGGRPEAATIGDYAEDVRAAVKFLRDRRKEVDPDRVAVVGHGGGGWAALVAAAREKRIDAVVLLATPGLSGNELVLAQQQRALERLNLSDAEKQVKIVLQQKIHQAVVSGKGWEEIPADLRRQADTVWFHSLLTFDPAVAVLKVRQPVLIVHGELDREVGAPQSERLLTAARERKGGRADVVRLPGINHLLAAAQTGEVDEYEKLPAKTVSDAVAKAVAGWLQKTS